jgi:hypothetical protein
MGFGMAYSRPMPAERSDRELLEPVLGRSGESIGLEVTVFDPDLDPDGRLAGELTDTLVAAFEAAARSGGAC